MIRYPPAWTTIYATEKDRRSFVETCLERSQPLPLEVTMDTHHRGWVSTGCSCDEDESGRHFPNKKTPCEWHFVFELLVHPKNLKRIQVLTTNFPSTTFLRMIKFRNFRFLDSPLSQLPTVTWKDEGAGDVHRIFPDPHSLQNLRSVTLAGRWTHSLTRVSSLTSFTIKTMSRPDAEGFRLFVSDNRSLESLKLDVRIRVSTKGPPVDLLNLKSLSVDLCPKVLSNIIRVPAFQRLSSLRISLEDEIGDLHTLRATGDGISLSVKFWVFDVVEGWQRLTEYAGACHTSSFRL